MPWLMVSLDTLVKWIYVKGMDKKRKMILSKKRKILKDTLTLTICCFVSFWLFWKKKKKRKISPFCFLVKWEIEILTILKNKRGSGFWKFVIFYQTHFLVDISYLFPMAYRNQTIHKQNKAFRLHNAQILEEATNHPFLPTSSIHKKKKSEIRT